MAEKIEREKRLDSIRKTADQLTEIARAYDRLRFMAERETTSDAFIANTGKADLRKLKAALRERQPSASWLRKVWYSEIRAQLGLPKHPRKMKQAEEA